MVLDLRGLKCPLPVLKSRKVLRNLAPDTMVQIETTDPLASIDIPHFCIEDGHSLILQEKTETGHRFLIRKLGS
jgi:tRNA 2-thiouridine synthesizing protein A